MKKKINKNVKKKNPTTSFSIYDFEIHLIEAAT